MRSPTARIAGRRLLCRPAGACWDAYFCGTTMTVSPPVLPVLPASPLSPVAPVAPLSPAAPVAPVAPLAPGTPTAAPVAPAAPVSPAGPAGPGTVTTAGVGVTTVLSQAVRPSVARSAAKSIEYFMVILWCVCLLYTSPSP